MAKNDAELQALEQPKSRNEEYLNFLCGRAVDINALPDHPYSRVEHYLEYLCHNGGIGGGGGQPFNGVTNVTYNAQTKELVVTHSNGLITNLDLSNLTDVTDVQYDNNTHIITITRNGVPSEIDLSKLNTKINNVAPVDGNIQLALNQAGDDISLTVGGQNAGTVSLNGYVKTVNNQPNQGGNVTVNAEHISYNNQTSNLISDNVKEAIDELKRDMDLIDSSEVRILADKTELDNLLGQGILSKGDIVYIIDSNGVIDYTGADVGNNGNPIAMIYDTDIPVPQNNNHLRVFSRFNTPIHITATNVEYDDNNTQLQANNVQGAIEKLKEKVDTGVTSVEYDNNKTLTVVTGGARQEYDLTPLAGIQTINRESGIDGNVNLSIDNTTNNVEFKVDTYTFGTLNYMTDQQADNIINGWSL